MKDKNFLFRGLEKQRERIVASEDTRGGWSGLQRDEEHSKRKKGDPSVRGAREGRKFLLRSPGNSVLDLLATREAVEATAGQLRCGPEAPPMTWGPGGSRGLNDLSPSPPLGAEETGSSSQGQLHGVKP